MTTQPLANPESKPQAARPAPARGRWRRGASAARRRAAAPPLRAVLEHAPMALALTLDGRFDLVSREWERLVGCEPGALHGRSWELLAPSQAQALNRGVEAAGREGSDFETELQLHCVGGSRVWVRLHGAATSGPGRPRQAIWVIADITEARRHRELLQWRATHDVLTELVNRREFERELDELIADRRSRAPACALFIDLDGFKQVNDTFGHAAGDALLKRIAQTLRGGVRGGDTVARLGGDEFAVLLRGCPLQEGLQLAEQLRAAVRAQAGAGPLAVSASIGAVAIDGTPASRADVLAAADRACYAAKRGGRNRVSVAGGLRP